MIRLALVLLLMSARLAGAREGVALPTGFDGSYAPEGMPCSAPERIVVKDGTMTGAGWSWTVTDLIEIASAPNRVEATLSTGATGDRATESARITLDTGAYDTALVFDYPDGTRNIWLRCD